MTLRGWPECFQRSAPTLRVNRKQADIPVNEVFVKLWVRWDRAKRQPLLLPLAMNSERSALLPTVLGTGNGSEYTLDTIHYSRPPTPSSHGSTSSYDSISRSTWTPPSRSRDIVVRAGLKMALIFVMSCAVLGGTLWLALPALDE